MSPHRGERFLLTLQTAVNISLLHSMESANNDSKDLEGYGTCSYCGKRTPGEPATECSLATDVETKSATTKLIKYCVQERKCLATTRTHCCHLSHNSGFSASRDRTACWS